MTSNHFFISKRLIAGEDVWLEGREHHHLSRVARVKARGQVWLFDEEGTKYRAEVEHVGRQKTRLRVIATSAPREKLSGIILAQALLKTKSMDWLIQKGTELGVDVIVPIIASRCVVKLDDGGDKWVGRWSRIALESCKQARRGLIPEILPPLTLEIFLKQARAAKKVFLSEHAMRPLKDILEPIQTEPGLPREAVILAGPEGGWQESEEDMILGQGFEAVRLGPNILRAETASLAAVAIISHLWNNEHVSSRPEGR